MAVFVCFLLGTCINNTSVMMFKKGSFEIGGEIYPVAIKASVKKNDNIFLLASTPENWSRFKYICLRVFPMSNSTETQHGPFGSSVCCPVILRYWIMYTSIL